MKCFLFVILLVSLQSFACVNTTYSRTDEAQITDDLAYIILGEFAHHGDAFYEKELKRTRPLIEAEKPLFDDLNDHGAALLKLGRYVEAEKVFLRNDKLYPNLYKTHSNLAVLYKKMGRFTDAEAALIKALEIQPEGHMGLGDYYLRMIQFLGKEDKSDGLNFLGHSYSMKPEEIVKQSNVNKEYLVTLIINDMSFADAYLLLGDVLFFEQNYQLALRAYYRASHLDKRLIEPTKNRVKAIFEYWENNKESGYILLKNQAKASVVREIKYAETWLQRFKETEMILLSRGKSPSFTEIKRAMQNLSLPNQVIRPVAYFKGRKLEGFFFETQEVIMGASFIGLLLIPSLTILFFIFKALRKRKAEVVS